MKSVKIEHRLIEYPHRTDYIHTVVDPSTQGSYTLISNVGFHPLVVVTQFGNVIGFDSFREMRKRLGWGTGHIRLIGYSPEFVDIEKFYQEAKERYGVTLQKLAS